MESTLIRVQGSRDYWDKVGVYARLGRTSTAALVKAAVDQLYGAKLDAIEPLFFEENVVKAQSDNAKDEVADA